MRADRFIFPLLILCSAGLFAYSSFRAYRVAFTHDESITHSIVAENSGWRFTSNNHPLNTELVTWMYRLLGDREWQLRIPNVVAHILYLGFGLLLLRRLKDPWLMSF